MLVPGFEIENWRLEKGLRDHGGPRMGLMTAYLNEIDTPDYS